MKKFILIGLMCGASSLSQAIGVAGHSSAHSSSHATTHTSIHTIPTFPVHSSHVNNVDSMNDNKSDHINDNTNDNTNYQKTIEYDKRAAEVALMAQQMADNIKSINEKRDIAKNELTTVNNDVTQVINKVDETVEENILKDKNNENSMLDTAMLGTLGMTLVGFGWLCYMFKKIDSETKSMKVIKPEVVISDMRNKYSNQPNLMQNNKPYH